MKHNTRANFI